MGRTRSGPFEAFGADSAQKIHRSEMKEELPTLIAAFDVYETLLFRAVGHHSAAHLLMGRVARRRGLTTHEVFVVAAARHQAEVRARRRAAGVDISLVDIHEELADSFGYGVSRMSEMVDLELEIEARITRSNEISRKRVAAARSSSDRIVFISDIYLPEPFVRARLEEHSLLLPDDGLYVSSSRNGATKRSRLLFKAVIQSEGVRAGAITHTGNNWSSDVLAARRSGLVAHYLPQGNLNRYEQALERWSRETAGLTSMMAGASRLARLDSPSREDRRIVTLRDVAAGVAAPVVVGFVLWLLDRAQREGVERLYFLAREGQVLYEVAKQLRARLALPVELRYLCVSRQSLNIAAAGELTDDELKWMLTHSATNSIRTILARLGSSPDVIADALTSERWDPGHWDEPIGTEELPMLLETITRAKVRQRLEAGMTEARQLAVEYLEQEEVLDPVSIGLVDSTGGGSQLRAIRRLRRARSLPSLRGYLVFRGSPEFLPDDEEVKQTSGWFGDEVRHRGYGSTPGRSALMEVICAADHGTTLGYERDAGRVRPLLSEAQAQTTRDWGLPVVRSTIARFVEELCLDTEFVDLNTDTRPAISEVMAMLWDSPTRDEADVWGRFPLQTTSGRGDVPAPLASRYRLGEVMEAVGSRKLRNRTWFDWRAASEQLSGPVVAGMIRAARFAKHATRRRVRQVGTLLAARTWRVWR